MFEDDSYKAHTIHNDLYEALKKSLELDYSNQRLADQEEARKKRRDVPRTPPGSPPSPPPPPPPIAGASGAPGTSGASGSSQLPPPPPPIILREIKKITKLPLIKFTLKNIYNII
ncbi:hypothetical protein Tco_1017707 [Tanacetum coccineum]|uniref:Uncharacterized protein n=1 Tax=Tanacetum coccineum TaxID=301880 RepID=A0ABQ5FS84_9ASTR